MAATPQEHWTEPPSMRDELLAIRQAATRGLAHIPELDPDAMHVVRRLVAAWEAFIEAARSDESLRMDLLETLTAALRDFADAWREAHTMPRLAVKVLVRLVPETQAAADGYEDSSRQDLYDASFALEELVQDCCRPVKSAED